MGHKPVLVRVQFRAITYSMSYVKLHNLLIGRTPALGPNLGQGGKNKEEIQMATIQKRVHPNGKVTYRARVRVIGMPDKSATFTTQSKAKIWAQKTETEFRERRHFPQQTDREKTFAQFIDRYIERELPKNPKSQKKQTQILTWWRKKLGAYFLIHISPSMIGELRDELQTEMTRRGKLRSSSTTNRYLASLSKAFSVSVREYGWMKENPVLKIQRPPEAKARDRFLDKEEMSQLLKACHESKSSHLYAVVLLALSTGARKGELLSLKWEDVDFSRKILTFRNTKNGETRVVPLTEDAFACLVKEKGKRIVFSEYVFPSLCGRKSGDIKSAWERAVETVGLKDVCFHTLRHTHCSWLAMCGTSTLEIAAILGHKTLSMVKRYAHFASSATAKALQRMNEQVLRECISD